MLDKIPNEKEMIALIGQSLYDVWKKLCVLIEERYDMDCLWDKGGKTWIYEYKYRRGGKTLCALYARDNCIGFMVILGKEERNKFERDRSNYSKEVQTIYDKTPTDTSLFNDFVALLSIKRKPNRNETAVIL